MSALGLWLLGRKTAEGRGRSDEVNSRMEGGSPRSRRGRDSKSTCLWVVLCGVGAPESYCQAMTVNTGCQRLVQQPTKGRDLDKSQIN